MHLWGAYRLSNMLGRVHRAITDTVQVTHFGDVFIPPSALPLPASLFFSLHGHGLGFVFNTTYLITNKENAYFLL